MENCVSDGLDVTGLRVLVVEDEFLLALTIEHALADAGCEVVGPFGRLRDAQRAARGADLDGAILDVRLHGETVSPVADCLLRSGVPVLFATAATEAELPAPLSKLPRLSKPVEPERLLAVAARLFKPPRAHPV